LADDFRVTCFFEAEECLKLVEAQQVDQPQFWGNLLGAIANATIASLPDSVYEQAAAELARRQTANDRLQRAVQKKITEKLSGQKA
jgi:hypothetical protein